MLYIGSTMLYIGSTMNSDRPKSLSLKNQRYTPLQVGKDIEISKLA